MQQYAIITKNEGNHPFPVGYTIELWGGNWKTSLGDLTTPDGDVPADSFKVVPESEVEITRHW